MDQAKTTASWTFWDLESPSDKEINDASISSREPIVSVSKADETDHEGICLACAFKQLLEAQENTAAEMYDLRNQVSHLVRMLGGK